MLKGVYDFVTGGRANVFSAQAIVTAPVIWSTAAQTGGPLLYNNSAASAAKGVTAYLLGMSCVVTTASTVAGAVGITGGASTAPTSTQAITSVMNLRYSSGAPASPQCNVYNYGTVSTAGIGFMPVYEVGTGALTVVDCDDNWVHLGGMIEVGYGNFAAVSASATLTTGVFTIGLVWAEVPND